MKALIKFLALVLVLGTAEGKIIRIPQDWPYIQTGVEMASDGDTVLVAPGKYLINHPSKMINFEGKAILLTSEKGADSTVIDGLEECGPIVTFESGEDTNSVIDGFTITNGRSDRGAGILCVGNSSPKICNNLVTANLLNEVDGLGAGICCDTASPVIVGNVISENRCQLGSNVVGGGGIFLRSSSASILNNTISENWATGGGGIACFSRSAVRIEGNRIEGNEARGGWINAGAGIYCNSELPIFIADNTIDGNHGYNCDGGGIYCRGDSIVIVSNTITNNSASKGGGIYTSSSSVQVSENNIYGNAHYGLYNWDTTGVVDADSNWWGDQTGPYHPSLNPGGLGDTVSSWVDFEPWLSKPSGVKKEDSYKLRVMGYELGQNWPNPFNSTTAISYQLSEVSPHRTTLKIYNVLGQEVRMLVDEEQAPGYYSVVWDGRDNLGKDVSSGIYFCRLKVSRFSQTRKMVLIR